MRAYPIIKTKERKWSDKINFLFYTYILMYQLCSSTVLLSWIPGKMLIMRARKCDISRRVIQSTQIAETPDWVFEPPCFYYARTLIGSSRATLSKPSKLWHNHCTIYGDRQQFHLSRRFSAIAQPPAGNHRGNTIETSRQASAAIEVRF